MMTDFATFSSTNSMMAFVCQPTILYFAVALLHLFSVLYFAVIRWFHVCAPYRDNPDYYYPARKSLSLMCLFVLVELPYVLCPNSYVCFLTACVVLAWDYPLAATLVCGTYFKMKSRYAFLQVLVDVILVAQVCFACAVIFFPSFCLQYSTYIIIVIATISFLLYTVLGVTCYVLYRLLRAECMDQYSDTSQFPVRMGYIALLSMLIIFVMTSLPLITQSRASLAIVQAILIVWHIVFLIRILYSQMAHQEEMKLSDGIDDTVDATPLKQNEQPVTLCASQDEILCHRIEEVMEAKQLYLDAHFTAVELAEILGTNRTYLTNAIKTKYENFYHLINSYRLNYAEDYQKQHPEVKKEQLATLSGFGSYRSYIRALSSWG